MRIIKNLRQGAAYVFGLASPMSPVVHEAAGEALETLRRTDMASPQ